jgi:hypothetical protein
MELPQILVVHVLLMQVAEVMAPMVQSMLLQREEREAAVMVDPQLVAKVKPVKQIREAALVALVDL